MMVGNRRPEHIFLPGDYVRRYEDGKDAELPQHAA